MKQGCLFILVIILFSADAEAAYHYVHQGAGGNGNDWGNAYGELPANLVRGDTYYIADGNYPSYTFDDAVSGSQYITIKKATAGDHGTDTGWQSSYGDGQAKFGSLNFMRSYYAFDGATRNENNWQQTESYGFMISSVDARSLDGSTAANIAIRYADIGGPKGEICTGNTPGNGIYAVYGGLTDWTISRSHIHNVEIPFRIVQAHNWVVEYNHIGPSWAKEAISCDDTSGWIIRHNRFIDNLIFPPSSCQHGGDGGTADVWTRVENGKNDNWEIYGNVFGDSGTYNNIVRTNAVVLGNYWSGGSDMVSGWKVYNNVFYNIQGGKNLVKLGSGTGNVVANNLWYKSRESDQSVGIINTGSSATNGASWCYSTPYSLCPASPGTWIVGSENPFVDAVNYDFRLKSSFSGPSPINKGVNLGSGFDAIDGLGNTRGADGTWDIGAYEYSSGQQKCSDGTNHGACTLTKPKHCQNGALMDNCQACGCPQGQTCQGDGTCQAQQQTCTQQGGTCCATSQTCTGTTKSTSDCTTCCTGTCQSQQTCIAGDLNCDKKVDIFDLVLVAQNYGKTSGFDAKADANKDGKIDIFDLVVVAQNYGKTSP